MPGRKYLLAFSSCCNLSSPSYFVSMPRFKRHPAPPKTRRKRRAGTPEDRKAEKLVARQRSSHSEDTVVDTDGEEELGPGSLQTKSKAEDARSSSLSSPSSLIAPPSPWLADRGPHESENTTTSMDKARSGGSVETTSDRGTPSPRPRSTTANTGLGEDRLQEQQISTNLAEASASWKGPSLPDNTTPSLERRSPPLQPNASASVPTTRSVPAARLALPSVATVFQHAPTYAPASYRPAVAPVRANPGGLATSMALATPEQQRALANRITYYAQNCLSTVEKNPLLTARDIRNLSKAYWRNLSFMDSVTPNIPETFYKPQLQMRAAYLWAQNCGMVPYSDIVYLLQLPPGFLNCWIRRFARVP
ncbi:hypothetical protein BU23DRAFT_597691 [Bimuria novae-zelandiae CBS 107.79]|uniref:Uncharacterized protein n=1 Tax=Bimuria novae-zelandiae CBS 107.79 TaxID=1447943 RepID=A0A6A5VEN5_9PLEO|nr:hypothetical protein BU23DRAFT_597691 [Bimuria novae-zelandiae CBS 107.79]